MREGLETFDVEFQGWRDAALKVGRWFRGAEEEAEVFGQYD